MSIQPTLPGMPVHPPDRIVNVASVPHRSPFRYPGGKTWLVPTIRRWLSSFEPHPPCLIEPFAGGGIVGLTAVFEGLVEQVILIELDEDVGAVWATILSDDADWLADQIMSFSLTHEAVLDLTGREGLTGKEHAFQTMVRNRVNRGGILAPGAGMIKQGENGKGLASRWYPETLARRIRAIYQHREKIIFIHGDGLKWMEQAAFGLDAVFFIDPPYSGAGKRLYTHWQVDHHVLFGTARSLTGDFLITYSNVEEIKALAGEHGFASQPVAMKNTHHAEMTELLIGRDLGWLTLSG